MAGKKKNLQSSKRQAISGAQTWKVKDKNRKLEGTSRERRNGFCLFKTPAKNILWLLLLDVSRSAPRGGFLYFFFFFVYFVLKKVEGLAGQLKKLLVEMEGHEKQTNKK